jgi:ABC-type phosphate transport system auxiliary subunit
MNYSSNTGPGYTIQDTNPQNGNTFIRFVNAGTVGGAITSNGGTTMTYGSASDYRLKENLTPLTGALAKVAALQPKVGNWKVDGSEFVGFLAHELQEVFPDAVVGEKDRVDADGNPLHQMVDTGSASIIATLAAAIQEQQQMIETLQAKVAALEAQ